MEHHGKKVERADEGDAWERSTERHRGRHKRHAVPTRRSKRKREKRQGNSKKKTKEAAPSAKGKRSVDRGRGRRPPDPRKKEKGVGVEATQTECAAEGAREARPRASLLLYGVPAVEPILSPLERADTRREWYGMSREWYGKLRNSVESSNFRDLRLVCGQIQPNWQNTGYFAGIPGKTRVYLENTGYFADFADQGLPQKSW